MGVIDGHDVRALREALREALAAERPVVVHIATVKGKGFAPAEDGGLEGMEKWHAAKPKSIANGAPAPRRRARPRRSRAARRAAAVHEGLRRGARARVRARRARRRDHRGDELRHRARHPPEGAARALLRRRHRRAAGGPVRRRARARRASSRSPRSTRRSCSARSTRSSTTSACRSSTSCFAMDRAGLVGDDGPTHHGAFDIAYLRCLPNIVLMAPRDEAMLVHMLRTALDYDDGPIALRYPRGEAVGVAAARRRRARSRSARGEILRERRSDGKVALIGYGSGVGKALEAAELLREHGTRGDGRRRALRQADRRRPRGAAGGRARAARDGRGGRARRRLRLGRVGDALRRRRRRRASCASACPTATSRTASPRCCTRRSASPAERIAERILAAVGAPHPAGTTA